LGAVDSPQKKERGPKKKKGFFKARKARLGIKIDMTPFVDIAFLLLIFFMATTVFRTPQALEINLPPDEDVEIKIQESNVLSVFVLDDERVFYKRGQDPWTRTKIGDLGAVFGRFTNDSRLVVLLKINREAKFNNMVKAIDLLDLARLTRFSLATLTDQEIQEVEAL
jgi:biopolymer transport protein ExbD